jgi:hypothetical protein
LSRTALYKETPSLDIDSGMGERINAEETLERETKYQN